MEKGRSVKTQDDKNQERTFSGETGGGAADTAVAAARALSAAASLDLDITIIKKKILFR